MLHLYQCNEKKREKNKKCTQEEKISTIENIEPNDHQLNDENNAETKLYNIVNVEIKYHKRKDEFNVKKIDNAAFYVTASLYIVFNILYWSTFLPS